MVRYSKNDERDNADLDQRFDRVESVSRKRRWIKRLMVYNMHRFVQRFPVQQAVSPVKIGVVHKDHQQYAEKVIRPSIFIDGIINQRVAVFAGPHYLYDDDAED